MITPKSFWLWFGGIWLSVGALFLVIGISVGMQQMRLNDRLEKEGRTVDGMVLIKEVYGKSRKGGSGSSPSYRVTFRFTPHGGDAIRGTADVAGGDWDALEERGPIRVTYLPDTPASHRVAGQSTAVLLPLIFSGVGAVIAPLGGFVVFNAVRRRTREKELARTGVMAEATITDIGPSSLRINGLPQMKLCYRFQDAQGKTREGSCPVSPEEAGNWLPGQSGHVRYNQRNPRLNIWIGRN